MTKKDYELIARAMRACRPDLPTDDMTDHGLDIVCWTLADELAAENPRFDRARFLRACGVEV